METMGNNFLIGNLEKMETGKLDDKSETLKRYELLIF